MLDAGWVADLPLEGGAEEDCVWGGVCMNRRWAFVIYQSAQM